MTLVLILVGFTSFGQDGPVFSYAASNEKLDLAEVANEPIPNDPFSEDIAMMMTILKNNYTYEVPPSATKPTPTTVVEKPNLYFAVKKVHKGFKKMVKKGGITNDEAIQRLSEIIQIAVNVRYQDTEALEETLRGTKEPEEIEKVFKSIEFTY
jgi:hypothetical protein